MTDRCGCGGTCGPNRRDVLRLAAGAALVGSGLGAAAGPFESGDFETLVPADKKLSPEWIASLYERGRRSVYRGADLEKIGMPVGGICTGQLYLGGDGKLWHWDIFNRIYGTGAEHYARPLTPSSPLAQGFAVQIAGEGGSPQVRSLDREGFRDISFIGEYPIGYMDYRDDDCPLAVSLEAFSPFVPLQVDVSSLPATVMVFTLKNTGRQTIEAEIAGWLENAVCLNSREQHEGLRRNRIVRDAGLLMLECSAEEQAAAGAAARADILFEDFEKQTYEGWTATGTAFGPAPLEKAKMPAYQGDVGSVGKRLVNTHNVRQGEDVARGDQHVGTLTSRPFTIQRGFINFLIGGGSHKGKTCINLLVDDKVVLSATGANDNRMQPRSWNVRKWIGRTARLQIVDDEKGPWGNIGIDQIVFSDRPTAAPLAMKDEPDHGTMALALLDPKDGDRGLAVMAAEFPQAAFAGQDAVWQSPLDRKLIGGLVRKIRLEPGASATAAFLLTWHFPNLRLDPRHNLVGRYYGPPRFDSASAVARHVATNFGEYSRLTRLWHDTWYDSTLPYWFLDRTFLNTSILASSTCYRFANGRFYGWEGVGCCPGTCGHVWHYAQAVARLFPELEQDLRRRVDFGLAQRPDGAILFRGEFNDFPAVDGQAGAILRMYREYQVSGDAMLLRSLWPNVKRAIQWLINEDGDGDGLLEGKQHNTLDADWYGPVAWLSSLYLAALRAGEEMAKAVGDDLFARRCREIFDRGRTSIVQKLFDGEYFINRPDPKRPDTINSGTGCHIDQVFGQSWAFQVGLGRILPEAETRKALASLWKHNFTPDVGPYRNAHEPGRWYAMAGEAGLLMCTFPRSDWDYAKAAGKGPDWAAGYFNECMTGFEYQVAGHMIWEGLVQEGLAITRAIHDRYHPSRRNPFNEVECGDHYARAMASYGVYLAACGFEYHGPNGHIGFAPRLSPDNFRCAFTAAEGWGTYWQRREGNKLVAAIAPRMGRVRVRSIALAHEPKTTRVSVSMNGQSLPASLVQTGTRVLVTLDADATINAGQKLEVAVG